MGEYPSAGEVAGLKSTMLKRLRPRRHPPSHVRHLEETAFSSRATTCNKDIEQALGGENSASSSICWAELSVGDWPSRSKNGRLDCHLRNAFSQRAAPGLTPKDFIYVVLAITSRVLACELDRQRSPHRDPGYLSQKLGALVADDRSPPPRWKACVIRSSSSRSLQSTQ